MKVSREIPLPWLIGIVATLFMQAALMYYQLNALVDAQAKTTAEIKELRHAQHWDLKDLEHDLKITDLQRQYADLQNRTASTEIRLPRAQEVKGLTAMATTAENIAGSFKMYSVWVAGLISVAAGYWIQLPVEQQQQILAQWPALKYYSPIFAFAAFYAARVVSQTKPDTSLLGDKTEPQVAAR